MKIIDPMILRFLAIPPCAILQLAMAAVTHSFTRDLEKLGMTRVFPCARQQSCAKKVGIVNRGLRTPVVAEAVAIQRVFAGQFQNPFATTLGHGEILFVTRLLECVEENLPNQTTPYDSWFLCWDASPAACEIEVVTPAVLGIARGFVCHQPVETGNGFVAKAQVARSFEAEQITPRHKADRKSTRLNSSHGYI